MKLEIPSWSEGVGDIQNIFIKLLLLEHLLSNKESFSNYKKRKEFMKFVYDNHKEEFDNDEEDGKWQPPFWNNHNSQIYIRKRFRVKDNNLPPIENVAKSFSLLISMDLSKDLEKWIASN